MIERKFIQQRIKKLNIKEFLKKELRESGFSHAEISKTPLGTRITIYTRSPGRVIGKGGRSINKLTEKLKKRNVENPIIEVEEIRNPELDPILMAKYVARGLERGFSFKRATYSALEKIENAGAEGAQIRLSGKVISKRKSSWEFHFGKIKYTGNQAKELVRKGQAVAHTKPGELGVKVKIIPPKEERSEENEGERIEKSE